MARPQKYKRILTGGGISLTGLSVSSTLVPSDAQHCQVLVDVIDDKDAFVMHHDREIGAHVLASIAEVRKLATSTMSLVGSMEAMEEAKNIAAACRTFTREYKDGDDPRVLSACLSALRAEVGESVAVLVELLSLRRPSRFDVAPYKPRALDILSGWMDQSRS